MQSLCLFSISSIFSRYARFPAAANIEASSNKSVTPPNAETTTMDFSFLTVSATMEITFFIFSALATEVPPNFNTCMFGNL